MRAGLAIGLAVGLMGSAVPAWSQSSGPSQLETRSALDTLHQALQLSAQQEAAWQAYRAAAPAPTVAQGRRRAASQMFPSLNAPQRMDLVEAEMKQELLDLQRQSQALKAFYATLGPQQKSTFDAQTLPPQNSLPPQNGQQQPGQ